MSATAIPTLDICPGDELLPVPVIFERITGSRPHPTTVVRWCKRGVSGVVLPSLIANGRRCSTMEAGHAWLIATTQARNSR